MGFPSPDRSPGKGGVARGTLIHHSNTTPTNRKPTDAPYPCHWWVPFLSRRHPLSAGRSHLRSAAGPPDEPSRGGAAEARQGAGADSCTTAACALATSLRRRPCRGICREPGRWPIGPGAWPEHGRKAREGFLNRSPPFFLQEKSRLLLSLRSLPPGSLVQVGKKGGAGALPWKIGSSGRKTVEGIRIGGAR